MLAQRILYKTISLQMDLTVNGETRGLHSEVRDRVIIKKHHHVTLHDALEIVKKDGNNDKSLQSVVLSGKRLYIKLATIVYERNRLPIALIAISTDGEVIEQKSDNVQTVSIISEELGVQLTETLSVTFNGAYMSITKPRFSVTVNDKLVNSIAQIHPNDQLTVIPLTEQPITSSDVFSFADYQLPTSTVSRYRFLHNKEPIQFYDQLIGGDILEFILTQKEPSIYWKVLSDFFIYFLVFHRKLHFD